MLPEEYKEDAWDYIEKYYATEYATQDTNIAYLLVAVDFVQKKQQKDTQKMLQKFTFDYFDQNIDRWSQDDLCKAAVGYHKLLYNDGNNDVKFVKNLLVELYNHYNTKGQFEYAQKCLGAKHLFDKVEYPFKFPQYYGCEKLEQDKPTGWQQVIRHLKLFAWMNSERFPVHRVYIPVTRDSFDETAYYDYWSKIEVCSWKNKNYIYARAQWENDKVTVLRLAEEGYRGDEDGFGREPDIWIEAQLDENGEFIVPFHR